MKVLASRRRHPLATAIVLMLALPVTGAAYYAVSPTSAQASAADVAGDADRGSQLFQANCATCHGPNAEGKAAVGKNPAVPSLIGVGAAAVDFQVGTGRMPMQSTMPQAPRKPVQLSDKDINDLGAFVAGLAPGPKVPDPKYLTMLEDPEDIAKGGEIYRINCAMCHNVAGAGGALTRGKYAPKLSGVSEKHIYEAMVTGPQSMPVFSDSNITPEDKQKVISYLKTLEEQPSAGGLTLGSIGPVSEGLFVWVFGMAALVGCTIWLGRKAI